MNRSMIRKQRPEATPQLPERLWAPWGVGAPMRKDTHDPLAPVRRKTPTLYTVKPSGGAEALVLPIKELVALTLVMSRSPQHQFILWTDARYLAPDPGDPQGTSPARGATRNLLTLLGPTERNTQALRAARTSLDEQLKTLLPGMDAPRGHLPAVDLPEAEWAERFAKLLPGTCIGTSCTLRMDPECLDTDLRMAEALGRQLKALSVFPNTWLYATRIGLKEQCVPHPSWVDRLSEAADFIVLAD